MKHLLATISLVAATATPALAETSKATVQDHYKTVIEQTPYRVEVCKNVQVPYGSKNEMDTGGAILGGIIGGVIGNQFGKGDGKEAMTGIGALSGAIIGGNKQAGPQGYRTEQRCEIQTRYEETQREVYSHSTVTFTTDGVRRTLKFQK
jgi:outer membrane lipoprotein SlyB